MRAILVNEYGGPEVLRLQEDETPPVGPGQARVRLHAAGVNFVDVYQRRGTYATGQLPFIPGREGAGVVEEVGAGVDVVRPGDRVAYAGVTGSYAETAVVP